MGSERQERKGKRKTRKGEKKTEYICSVREIKCVFAEY
jgi:hypothetical protein